MVSGVQVDFLGESTSGNLRFVQRVKSEGIVNVLGLQQLDDIIAIPYKDLKESQQVCLCFAADEHRKATF